MSECILCRGQRIRIEFAVRRNGSMPAKDFFDNGLTELERHKLRPPMARLADDGRVANQERFKKVEGTNGLWEFKLHQIRIFGFFLSGARFILTNGIRKKQDRLSRSDIAVAEAIRGEHISHELEG